MKHRNFRTNANEGSDMLRTEHSNYRWAFLDCTDHNLVLAIVASVLWWRLSHTGTASQPGATSASESVGAMAQTSPAKCLAFRRRIGGRASGRRYAGDAACTDPAHAAADAEHRHCAGKVESKPVNTEVRFYGNVQVDERRQATCRRDSRDGFAESMPTQRAIHRQGPAAIYDLQS